MQESNTEILASPLAADPGNGGACQSRLEIVRRLDWRFLLPEPKLDSVLYAGPEHGDLLPALRMFCESLNTSFFPGTESLQHRLAQPALVVAKRVTRKHLESVTALLDSGGYVYWELERRGSSPGMARLQSYQKAVQFVSSLGFSDIEAYWHRPTFEACLEIIPLNDRRVHKFVFSRNKVGLKGVLQTLIGQVFRHTNIPDYFVPCVSLVARKQ